MGEYALVLLLGFAISLVSGLLGIGGGIVMAPALLYLPPFLGVAGYDMKQVAGLTITQGLAACVSAALRHDKHRQVNWRLVRWMGPAILVTALTGSVVSKWTASATLLLVFAGLAAVAAVLMFFASREESRPAGADPNAFSVPVAVAIAATVGALGGMVGQGGSFILIPLILVFLRLPTRMVIGTNLALVAFASLAGFVGKMATNQILLLPALFLVAGAIPGAQLGSVLSQQTQAVWLRRALTLVIFALAVGIGAHAIGQS